MNIGTSDINVFDCKITFDTPNLLINFDLSPSQIAVPASVSNISVLITKPNGDIATYPAWTGTPNTLATIFKAPIPTISDIIMWGYYKFKIVLTKTSGSGGFVYTIEKKYNLCAPEDVLSNVASGWLEISKDCDKGTVKLTGLSGYYYKQKQASKEELNVTLYYPQESEVPPIKNISYLPLEIDAYIGQFVAKGVVDSTYDFDDLVSVRLRYIASAKRDVRCGSELRNVFAGLNKFYEEQKDTELYRTTMEQVNPILNLILVGLNDDIDVTDRIQQIEELLGNDFGCMQKDGQKVLTNNSLRITANPDFEAVKNAVRTHPNYVSPTLVLESSQSNSGLEVGQSITIPLRLTYIQNDGGAQTSLSINKNGVSLSTVSPVTDTPVIMTTTPKVYQGVVTFGIGPIKLNNLQEPDTYGRILSATIVSQPKSYRGYYYSFFGPVATNPSNSAAARVLSKLEETIKTFILNTGTSQVNFAAILPPGSTIVSVIDLEVSANITSAYVLVDNIFAMKDAGNVDYTAPKYLMTQDIPYSVNHRHQITIS